MSSLLGVDDALRKLVDVVDVAHTGKGLKQQRRNAKTNRGKRGENGFFCLAGLGAGFGRAGSRLPLQGGRFLGRLVRAGSRPDSFSRFARFWAKKTTRNPRFRGEIGKIKARERKQKWRGP